MKPCPQSRRRANPSASSQPQRLRTPGRASGSSLLLLALCLALAPTASASNTWYVDGVNGSDNNNCKTRQHACKTIGHAISLAQSGDSIMVAAATYTENLTIKFGLKVIGSGATTTIIDGSCVNRVLTISSPSANVTLSKFTIQNGCGSEGGGIYNKGTLTINDSTISGNRAGTNKTPGYAGGIENKAALTISNCTVSGNRATGGFFGVPGLGGGVGNNGRLTITNSTIIGNQVGGMEGRAGGIYNCCSTPVTVNNSTVAGILQASAALAAASMAPPHSGTVLLPIIREETAAAQ